MQCERDGTTLAIYAPDEETAQLIESLCLIWPQEDSLTDTQLGDLTAYNAARQPLLARRDALSEERDAAQVESENSDVAVRDAALIRFRIALLEIDLINAMLRATERDTNPGGTE